MVFAHVNVVDVVKGQVRRDQMVVVTGTRIRAVGAAGQVAVPAGARVVDARGQYLMPGLWDMHSHIGAGALPAEQSAVMRDAHVLLLANGVTGFRDAGTSVPLDSLLAWRRAILAGTRVGPPRQLLAGRSLQEQNPNPDIWDHLLVVSTAAEARRAVDSLLAAGADYIKVHDLSPPLHDSLVVVLRQRGVLFGGHLDTTDIGARLLDHGFASLANTCWGGPNVVARCRFLAERMRERDMWFVANPERGGHLALARALSRLTLAQQALAGPLAPQWRAEAESLADWSAATRDSLAKDSSQYWSLYERVGIPLLVGTDGGQHQHFRGPYANPWRAAAVLHDQLAGMVQRGVSPQAALQAATLNPARALHATDSLGTVAVGKFADLVLLDGDPLTDIRNTSAIRGVMANGRYFDRAALDSLLASVDYTLAFHWHRSPPTRLP